MPLLHRVLMPPTKYRNWSIVGMSAGRVGAGLHAGPLCSEVASTFGDPHTATAWLERQGC